MTAAFSITMLVVSALAIDVGTWFVESGRIQRAADAAALAGVVWLPNMSKATAVAQDVASENGYLDGDGTEVEVERIGVYSLRVNIRTDGALYFGKAILDDIRLGRSAQAEYTLPVPMGSRRSAIGTGTQVLGAALPANFNLSINAPCSGQENGDLVSPFDRANQYRCKGDPNYPATAVPNPDYDPNGYKFGIQVRPGAGSIDVDIYNAGRCGELARIGKLRYELFAADDTPLTDADNPMVGSWDQIDGYGCGVFSTLFTIPSGAHTGRWFLRVRNQPDLTTQVYPNNFGIWAKRSGDLVPCDFTVDATCPNVFAIDNLPIQIRVPSAQATFDLAEVPPEYAGNTIVIQTLDPGEGSKAIQILDPAGHPMEFTYYTVDGDYGPQPNDMCDVGPCLDTNQQGPAVYEGLASPAWKYNARKVVIEVRIPDKATMEAFPNSWFQVRYHSLSGAVTDQTTWSVSIKGNPVHLID